MCKRMLRWGDESVCYWLIDFTLAFLGQNQSINQSITLEAIYSCSNLRWTGEHIGKKGEGSVSNVAAARQDVETWRSRRDECRRGEDEERRLHWICNFPSSQHTSTCTENAFLKKKLTSSSCCCCCCCHAATHIFVCPSCPCLFIFWFIYLKFFGAPAKLKHVVWKFGCGAAAASWMLHGRALPPESSPLIPVSYHIHVMSARLLIMQRARRKRQYWCVSRSRHSVGSINTS